ncbi:MAG: guanylate kinase [Phycisphaerales bacterium]|nr:guanylate kinase [Phycisphaerales bacterium]
MAPETNQHRLPTDTDTGMLLVISGPSGAGKTTITRAVERAMPGAVFSVSATTRAKTDADVDGVDYHFVSEEQFQQMVERDEFLEYAGVYGKRYGTPRAWVFEQLRRGRLVILEIDVQGAKIVKGKVPEMFSVFILPPSEEELLRRLRSRKREDEQKIQRRFAAAKQEILDAERSGVYDRFIVNNVLEASITEAIGAVQAELNRRSRRG